MSGLLALLDDVAAIAQLAATRLDVVSGHATKAGAKAAGVVIDVKVYFAQALLRRA